MTPVLSALLTSPALILLAVALLFLMRAGFAAATETKDPVLANLASIEAEIKREFEEGRASKKQIDERLAAVERALTESRLLRHEGQESDEDKQPKGRIVSGLMRSILQQRNGAKDPWKGFEKERDFLSTNDSDVGYLIPATTDPFLMKFLRPNTLLDKLGVRGISAKGIPHRLIEVATGPSGGWVGSTNPTVSDSKPSTAAKEITPKMYAMLCKVDRTALQDADMNLESELRDLMMKKIAEDMDLAFFSGLGSQHEPRGVLRYTELQAGGSQVVAIGPNGGTVTFDHVSKLIGMLEDANAMTAGAKLAFVSHPKNRRILKKERIAQYSGDAGGDYVIPGSPIMSDAQFEAAIGHPWHVSTQLPVTDVKGSLTTASPILFANWADSIWGVWPGTEIIPLYEVGATVNQVWFLVFKRADFLIQRVASFAAIRDADISAA